jgi:hypothetical protein
VEDVVTACGEPEDPGDEEVSPIVVCGDALPACDGTILPVFNAGSAIFSVQEARRREVRRREGSVRIMDS